ncbi:hypothetical protein HZ326_22416 [Fusarium oxysporum f. sp. albedinis]|nr:hypothetical protein HZ326_22416 [Fusarium oxysporum f. sp. albedinis]
MDLISYAVFRVFPAKHIHGFGTFQDAGPLENDPLISALTAAAKAFPLLEEPDFIVSLGTGEPKPHDEIPITNSRNTWKNGALPRLFRLVIEKMRDKKLRQAFQGHPRYHRLNVQFDGDEPRLDDVHRIPELRYKAEQDQSISKQIDSVARCFVASLFYFELDSLPRQIGGKYRGKGRILCSIQQNDPAFSLLFSRLSQSSAQFWIDGWPEVGHAKENFDSDGNFRKTVELNTNGKFTITLQESSVERCNISGNSPLSGIFYGLLGHTKLRGRHRLPNSSFQRRNFGEFTFSDNTFVGSNGGTSEPERLRYRRTVPVASVATSSRSTTPIAMGFFPFEGKPHRRPLIPSQGFSLPPRHTTTSYNLVTGDCGLRQQM